MISIVVSSNAFSKDFNQLKDYKMGSLKGTKKILLLNNVNVLESSTGDESHLLLMFQNEFKTQADIVFIGDEWSATNIDINLSNSIFVFDDIVYWCQDSYGLPTSTNENTWINKGYKDITHIWELGDLTITLEYNDEYKDNVFVSLRNKNGISK